MIQESGITIEREIYEMKKIVSIVLTLAMLLSVTPAAFAIDATGLEAQVLPSTHIVNVTGCVFDNIPTTSHKICAVPYDGAGKIYAGWTLNTDVDTKDVYWNGKKVE